METTSDVSPSIDMKAFEQLFAKRMRWASLHLPLSEVESVVPDLLMDLKKFEQGTSLALLAGLLTHPDYQSNTLRLELLVALAFVNARGVEQPDLVDAARWFEMIDQSEATSGEDAAEDVFVTLVADDQEDFLLLEGLWENAGFYTQCCVDLLSGMPDTPQYKRLRKEVRALLVVADEVCKQSGLTRYQTGSDKIMAQLIVEDLPQAFELQRRAFLGFEALSSRGVQREDLEPFFNVEKDCEALRTHEPGLSQLDRQPLLETADGLIAMLPTAISIALRDHVIAYVLATSQVQNFNRNYAKLLSRKVFETQLFGTFSGCPVHWRSSGVDQYASALIEFDYGHVLAMHFILPSIATHRDGGFKYTAAPRDSMTRDLEVAVAATMAQSKKSFHAGIHLFVLCGWGKGMGIQIPRIDDLRWKTETIALADLIRLSDLDSMAMGRFWRLQTSVDTLQPAGVEIMNLNGLVNLIGWVELNDGHLIPHAQLEEGRISPESPLVISPPLNLLRDVRARADYTRDFHVRMDSSGAAHYLERLQKKPYFPNSADSRIYVSLTALKQGELVAACLGKPTTWVRLAAPAVTSRDLVYRLWEMLVARVARIVDATEELASLSATYSLLFCFEDSQEEFERYDAEVPQDLGTLIRFRITSAHEATITFLPGYVHAFQNPQNIAERILSKITIQALAALVAKAPMSAVASDILARAVPNDRGRHFHRMHAHAFTDYVRDTLPAKPLVCDDIDSATLRLGLGWTVHEGSNHIEGDAECRAFLNALVDKRVEHVMAQLQTLNRYKLTKRLLINHAVGEADEQHWKRTSAAVLGLHGDTPATRSTVVEKLSALATTQICSRILIEMAICACPLGDGRIPSNLEIEALFAEISLLNRLGSWSDGIYYGALEPRLKISPLGEILLTDAFAETVVTPMLSTVMGDRYVRSTPDHDRYYAAPVTLDSTANLLEDEFLQAWKKEMGFTIDDGRKMLDVLENDGIVKQEAVLMMTKSQLLNLLGSAADQPAALHFLDRFALVTRDSWSTPPSGFKGRDILPWRFGRRLSVVSRPIVQLDLNDDPTYLVLPSLVRRGFFNVLRGAHAGTIDQDFFTTPEMRDAWWGKANEGHTFNAEVAEMLRSTGWQALENIELSAILKQKLERAYGDVDVLAWHNDRPEVLVIECKDLTFRRNYSEIAALLSDYKGARKNGKPDKLLRHLMRVDRLQQGLTQLGRYIGIETPRICSCLIVGGIVPMQFAKVPALESTFVGDLETLLQHLDHSSAKL
ncbi:hypothetical protein G7025_23980 [Pseudomonas lurida]|uniref:hypothetical protein n=1 Tax=Pseudomonas TaxID=286 RepID=UPI0015E3C01E|nr:MULTISPECIES: hypothetical protein [Pseudomonas]MBA1296424.1 hypothetical protein [Pseudomonas lurida]